MRTEKRDLGFAFGTLVLISWRPFGFEWRDFDGLEALHIVVHVSRMAREICHGSESGCAEVVRRPSVAACRLPTPFCVSQPVFLQPRCSYVQAPAPLPACNVFSASFGARCCCCKSFAFCCRPPKTRRHPCISCLQGCRCMHSLQSELRHGTVARCGNGHATRLSSCRAEYCNLVLDAYYGGWHPCLVASEVDASAARTAAGSARVRVLSRFTSCSKSNCHIERRNRTVG